MKKIEHMQHITRSTLRTNSDKIFLFGDNLLQIGYGGQAKEMRGEPNAIGIPTKKKPSMSPDSFFTDDEYESNIIAIGKAFNKIPDNCTIVLPQAGLGTGLAELPEKAPKTFAYLYLRLMEMK